MRPSSFLFTVLALCISCQSPTDSNPFWTVIEATPATLQLGDTMAVRVTLKNTSSWTQTTNAHACPRRFLVRTLEGAVLDGGPTLCTLELIIATVEPGGTLVFEYRWDGKVGAGLLAPGAYRLTPPDGFRGNSVEISIVE